MSTRYYRVAGAFELLMRPRGVGTLMSVDLDALSCWGVSVARRAGLDVRAAHASDAGVRMVAIADTPGAIQQLARWAPSLVVTPLHRAEDYVVALAKVLGERRR